MRKLVKQAGLTLLEVLLSVAILSMVVVGVAALSSTYTDTMVNNDYALLIKTVGEAATEYVQDNAPTIKNTATQTTPKLITLEEIRGAGYLDGSLGSANTYNHKICVLVLKADADTDSEKLNALLVTEGGTAMDDINLSETAAVIGAAGGGIYKSDANTIIRGTLNGWKLEANPTDPTDKSAFFNQNNLNMHCDGSTAGNIDFSAGHVYMALWFPKKKKESVLHRDPMGDKNLNTMNTPILMGDGTKVSEGGDCSNQKAGALARISVGTTGAATEDEGMPLFCDGSKWRLFWGNPVTSFDALPTCDGTHNSGQTRVVKTAVGSKPVIYNCNGTEWQAMGIDKDGNLTVPKNLAVTDTATISKLDGNLQITSPTVVPGADCGSKPNGSIALDNIDHDLTVCRDGKWKKSGATPDIRRGESNILLVDHFTPNGSADGLDTYCKTITFATTSNRSIVIASIIGRGGAQLAHTSQISVLAGIDGVLQTDNYQVAVEGSVDTYTGFSTSTSNIDTVGPSPSHYVQLCMSVRAVTTPVVSYSVSVLQ